MTNSIQPGDVVQINPSADVTFGGCFLVVDRVAEWGVRGFITVPQSEKGNPPSQIYYRIAHGNIQKIGTACWVPDDFGGSS